MIQNTIGVIALSKREILRFFSVASQTIFPPLISSTLFICIFGLALGNRIDLSTLGMSYLKFIIPGLMTMHLITSSYENTCSSLFIARWHNHIQEVLLSPLSYFEMVLGLLAGGVARGCVVVTGVFLISFLFEPMGLRHPLLTFYFIITISAIFSCVGMIAALWAEDFNMLSMWNTYFILPSVFLGGVFHPVRILPESLQLLTALNPMYYFVNGMRYSITGISDIPVALCMVFALTIALGAFFLTVQLFRMGYKLRT